jgi:hypothetical protein
VSLKRPYTRKLRLVTHPAYPEYTAFQLTDGGDWVIQSKETGHIYPDRFANEDAAKSHIGDRFYGVPPRPPVMRAMAVRCRVGVAPFVFGQVYMAVSYEPKGFFDKLSVYIPNMWGDYRALPADASIFDPVADEHKPRFKHHAVEGFEPLSAAIGRIVDRFGAGAITTGRQMAGAA